MRDRIGQGQRAHEVAQIVGQGVNQRDGLTPFEVNYFNHLTRRSARWPHADSQSEGRRLDRNGAAVHGHRRVRLRKSQSLILTSGVGRTAWDRSTVDHFDIQQGVYRRAGLAAKLREARAD